MTRVEHRRKQAVTIVLLVLLLGTAFAVFATTAMGSARFITTPIGYAPPPPTLTWRTTHVEPIEYVPPTPRPALRAPTRLPELRSGPCGGDLPPCWVLDRESGHRDGIVSTYDVNARNPGGCSGRGCFGKWQCDPRTCDGTGTEAEQDAEARRVWDHGNGCGHWGACR